MTLGVIDREIHCCTHLLRVFDPARRRRTVRDICKLLRPVRHSFDTIVVTGVSGLTIGATVATRLHCGLTVVRKEEATNSDILVEGTVSGSGVFLDDLVDSGTTIARVGDMLREHTYVSIVGVLLYADVTPIRNAYEGMLKRQLREAFNTDTSSLAWLASVHEMRIHEFRQRGGR